MSDPVLQSEPIRPKWNRQPRPLTEGAPGNWRVERRQSPPAGELQRLIDEKTPSNEELLRRARRPESKPPQTWYDDREHPFRPDRE